MNSFKYFYEKTILYDSLNKFLFYNIKKLPKLKKMVLNFSCNTTDIKQLSSCLLAIELITNSKANLTKAKKSNINLKIRKGNPTGCKITLKKYKMFLFLTRLVTEVFPNLKNLKKIVLKKSPIKKKSISYNFQDNFIFNELEKHYTLFANLPKLNVTIVTNSNSTEKFEFIIESLKLNTK